MPESTHLDYPWRADHYTYRVPTPPRIVVAPPRLNQESLPDISLRAPQVGPHAFLRDLDYTRLVAHNAPLEWTYERRRAAQPVLPFLALGPLSAAKDTAYLSDAGITMLLGLHAGHTFAVKQMNAALRPGIDLGLEHHTVAVHDPADLIRVFPHTTALITEHMRRAYHARPMNPAQRDPKPPARVLVVCETGNERGAAVVAAYLMESHEDVDHVLAIQLVQAQRFCANFDDALKRQLQAYWDILCARRAVYGVGGAPPAEAMGGPVSSMKRALVHDDAGAGADSEMELDSQQEDDLARFGGRTFAPFVDVSADPAYGGNAQSHAAVDELLGRDWT